MRTIAALLLTAVLASAQSNNGTIEGRVLRTGSSAGIANLRVIISLPSSTLPSTPAAQEAADNAASSIQFQKNLAARIPGYKASSSTTDSEQAGELPPGSLTPAYLSSTVTDSTGHFVFKNLSPGKYTIQIDGDGTGEFAVSSNGNPTMILREHALVEARKETPALTMFMAQGGAITGVIRDSSGRPLPRVSVQTTKKIYSGGIATFALFAKSTETNDRGEYRLFGLPPGEYFISAGSKPSVGGRPLWQQTFFPGVTEPAKFVPIVLKGDGAEITGISFNLRDSPPTTFMISGVATNPLPNAARDRRTNEVIRSVDSFILVPHKVDSLNGLEARTISAQNSVPGNERPHDEFEIRDVRPGVYDLYARSLDKDSQRMFWSRKTTIDVRSDIKDVSLAIEPGVPLAAEIVIEGPNPAGIKPTALRLNILFPVDKSPFGISLGPIGLPFDSDGKLTLPEVAPARYSAMISPMPKSWYVADIRQGGVSVWKSGFVVDRNAPPVQFIVNTEAKSISGTVRFNENKTRNIVVVLLPPADELGTINRALTTNASSDGRFSFQGVRPGPYTLYAWENPPDINPWLNAEFLASYEGKGKAIVVSAVGFVEPQELELIPHEQQ